MKFARDKFSEWRLWRLSGRRAFLIVFIAWAALAWILAPLIDLAYWLSIFTSFAGPTAVFCFLFLRDWILRSSYSRPDGLSRRLGSLAACGVTAFLAVQTAFAYDQMNDAPRGLLWDINVCISPLLGMITMLLVRLAVHPRSLFRSVPKE